jgi:Apg6 BARA domain
MEGENGIAVNGTHQQEDSHLAIRATPSLLDDDDEDDAPDIQQVEENCADVVAAEPNSSFTSPFSLASSGMKDLIHLPNLSIDRLPSSTLLEQQQVLRDRLRHIRAERRACQIRQRQCDELEEKLQTTLAVREHEQQRLYEEWSRYRNGAEIPMPSSHWNVTASDAFCIVCEHGNWIASINGLRLGAVVPVAAPPKAPAGVHPRTPALPLLPPLSHPPASMLSRAFASSMANGGPPVPSPPEPTAATPASAPTTVVWHTIPWVEINAALGQVALLLSTLEQSLQQDSQPLFRYQLLCRGSTSQIGLRPGKAATTAATTWYNLFYSEEGTFHLLLFAKKRNFDTALQCLLSCVDEARTLVQARDRTVVVPYAMQGKGGGTIAGLPVACFTAGGTQPITWTRAMKYLLTNLKHLLLFRGLGLWKDGKRTLPSPAGVSR